jgi:hypothetical protein
VKRVVLCFTLAALPGVGGSRQAPVAPIALYTQFQEEPSAAVREALESELDAIMEPAGLRFEWRSLASPDRVAAPELVVVTFQGRCDVDRLQPVNVLPGALGWTHMTDGVVLPFSDIDCSAVRGFLQKELLNRPPSLREEIYGRALGRVLAHELYHVLAGTSNHGADGVAKPGYTVGDLMARDFSFEVAELRVLLESKTHQVLERAVDDEP